MIVIAMVKLMQWRSGRGGIMAQSAMEFFMTYGWAILILVIVIAALFELGVFNHGFAASTCIPIPGFVCKNPVYSSNDITFTLGQTTGHDYYGNWVFVASQGEALNSNGVPVNFTGTPINDYNAVQVGYGSDHVLIAGQAAFVDFNNFAAGAIQSGAIVGTDFAGYVWLGYCPSTPCSAPTAYEKVATMTLVSVGGMSALQQPAGGGGGGSGVGGSGSAGSPYNYNNGWQGAGYYYSVPGNPPGNTIYISSQSQYDSYAGSGAFQYLLRMSVNPSGSGIASPGNNYFNTGSNVIIAALPDPNYQFDDWTCSGTGCYSGVSQSALITVDGNIIETANFVSSTTSSTITTTTTTTTASTTTTTTTVLTYNPMSGYSGSDNVEFSSGGTLSGDITTTGSITIDAGVTVTSDGHSFIAGGTFTNYGTIDTGSADNGGAGGTHCCTNPTTGGSYLSSYGGSGGGGGGGYLANGGDGGDTLVYGGFGGVSIPLRGCGNSMYDGIDGSTPSNPARSLTNNQIQSFYGNGMANYLSGAGGGGGGEDTGRCDGNGGDGGAGAYGLYIQATTISTGIINSSGRNGADGYILGCGNGGGGGGGGGGSIVLAYETAVSPGTITDAGGVGGRPSYDNGCALAGYGGAGGNGQIIEFQYSTPPVNP